MSIASTQLSMGYAGSTTAEENCGSCDHAAQTDTGTAMAARAPGQVGLRCLKGAFFTVRSATCRQFERVRVQIGPTDV